MTRPIVVYGAGGLGREVEWLIRRINSRAPTWEFRGYVVTDADQLGPEDSKEEVVGDETWLLQQRGMAVALGIGTPKHRCTVGKRLEAEMPAESFPPLIDPSAIYDERSCKFAPGSIVTAGNVLTVNIVLEPFAFLNLDCTVGHEATIGYGSVLNPSVNVSGGVTVGEGVLVGTGAQILQYHTLGNDSVVGASALVNKDVTPGATVVGVPAKPIGA